MIYLNTNVVLSLFLIFLPLFCPLFPISPLPCPGPVVCFPLLFLNNYILKPSDGAKKGKHLHRWGWGQGVGQNLGFRAQTRVKRVFVGWEESPNVRYQNPVQYKHCVHPCGWERGGRCATWGVRFQVAWEGISTRWEWQLRWQFGYLQEDWSVK